MADQAQTVFQAASAAPEVPAATTVVNSADTAPNTVTVPPELASLVGPGKKYATVDAALASIPHAQSHIATTEAENKKLREQLAALEAKARGVEDILASVEQRQESSEKTTQTDVDSVAERVVEKLNAKTAEEKQATNLQEASDMLVAKVGGDQAEAVRVLKLKAAEVGLSVEALYNIAKESPRAFMAYFGGTSSPEKDGGDKAAVGTMNTNGLAAANASQQVKPGTHAYWQKMRKEKGNDWYFSSDATRQRIKDAGSNPKFYG